MKINSNIEGSVRVGLMITSGVEVSEIYAGALEANEEFDGSSLPSGMCIIRLVSVGQVTNLKLVIKK